ncbi:MAG: flagellar basal body rod protein FlgC [Lachnospiraceae bacterium]|jgi:flagellar basal-body rod protein FlgC|nr:flagellar basal body rod protein FlgC [Lachnospiraceae bacterium]
MAMFTSLNISATGMTAQQLRMDILSQNMANVGSTRTNDGTPYRRKNVVFEEKDANPFSKILNAKTGNLNSYIGNGVKVTKIIEDTKTPMTTVYDPSHPDADENGYVTYPNVNPITEMTDLIDASRAYEANVTAFNAAKAMALKALEIGK